MTSQIPMHYVCTLSEATDLINSQKDFWVIDCGCRKGKGSCKQSRMDVCLNFNTHLITKLEDAKKLSREGVEYILAEASSKRLVPRPFRSEDRFQTEGICFCCSDCCGYFLSAEEACDKGKFVEKTDLKNCTNCGLCENVCHFGSRLIEKASLQIDHEKCFGCGLCVDVCPTNCIQMTKRVQ
ncbi:MAG: 4Fe-4S binding protein [Candidatus Riflebacteria bacterium]|nr:4Fe-4S binding protein [Candidatus Riflebacteria bacterium]